MGENKCNPGPIKPNRPDCDCYIPCPTEERARSVHERPPKLTGLVRYIPAWAEPACAASIARELDWGTPGEFGLRLVSGKQRPKAGMVKVFLGVPAEKRPKSVEKCLRHP